MAKKTGGPAFPCDNIVERNELGHLVGHEISSGGMTIRDYFAAHAPTPTHDMELAEHCAYRYRYADAMLAAREE